MSPIETLHHRGGRRILFAGTGGQGVLTCARLLGDCLVDLGHHVVSGQLHGMAQRGGSVQSTLIVDAGPCPVIAGGRADFVVGFEPVETARALPFMSRETVVCMNTTPVIPYVLAQRAARCDEEGRYPDVGGLVESIRDVAAAVLVFDATQSAVEAGSVKAMNVVMLGCLLGLGALPCTPQVFWDKAKRRIPHGHYEANAEAFIAGERRAAQLQVAGEPS